MAYTYEHFPYSKVIGTGTYRFIEFITGSIPVPTSPGSIKYTGEVITPVFPNYDSIKMVAGGTTSATEVGSYTATFTPKSGYYWDDGTGTVTKQVTWSIYSTITKTIHFTQTSDITDNFTTYVPSGAAVDISSNHYMRLYCGTTDKVPNARRTYTEGSYPTSVEIYARVTGGMPDFVTNQLGITLTDNTTITYYLDHYSGDWSSYLPFPSYSNHSIISRGSTAHYTGSKLSYGTWYKFKFVNTGTAIQVYLNDTLMTTITVTASIKRLNIDLESGWWQTNYVSYVDYVTEVYE